MSSNSSEYRSLLRHEGSDLSDASTAIDTPQSTPSISFTHRQSVYSGPDSHVASPDLIDPRTPPLNHSIGQYVGPQGLGLSNSPNRASFPRKPVKSRAAMSPPSPSNPFATPPEASSPSSPFTPTSPPYDAYYHGPGLQPVNEADEDSLGGERRSTFREDLFGDSYVDSRNNSQYNSISAHHNFYEPTRLTDGCPTAHDIFLKRTSWLPMTILIGSVYSTIFSCIWLVLALVAPVWAMIRSSGGGSMNASAARTVITFFAKTIEMTFITSFVAFLGQVLSRRSLMKSERGMSISEMTMRSWVIQPGSMVTHWHNLHHAGISFLGVVTLIAAFASMFYTTASDALVSPHLKYGRLQEKVLFGSVLTSYGNPRYAASTCKTPGPPLEDNVADYGSSCLQVQHAGQAYHNGLSYLRTWDGIKPGSARASSDIKERPLAPAMLYDNTTVTGSWILTETSDMAKAYAQHKRVINNVTLAMPHAGLFSAARHPKNGILQPEQLDGIGKYAITASVVSPAVNVMCVNANFTELEPIIYAMWPNSPPQFVYPEDGKTLAPDWAIHTAVDKDKYLNSTVLDDIFQWGEKYKRQPPMFPLYPKEHNSMINASMKYPGDAYLLIKADKNKTEDFTLCQFKSFLTFSCSTHYNVDGATSGHLKSTCDHPNDNMRYDKSVPDPPRNAQPDWANIAGEWLRGLALNNGVFNSNSSNPRMLSQFIQVESANGTVELNPLVPSIAEHLAVLAGHTLLMSTTDSTFRHYWGYPAMQDNILKAPGELEGFNATIRSQQYGSGFAAKWECMFFAVLLFVFLINGYCLVYFMVHPGLVTDFTEQENLFALAMNSPPTARLSGSCGAGPEGTQMGINFRVVQDERSTHYYLTDSGHDMMDREMGMVRRQYKRGFRHRDSYKVLSSQRGSWL